MGGNGASSATAKGILSNIHTDTSSRDYMVYAFDNSGELVYISSRQNADGYWEMPEKGASGADVFKRISQQKTKEQSRYWVQNLKTKETYQFSKKGFVKKKDKRLNNLGGALSGI